MSFTTTTTTTTATATAKSICTYSLFGENDDNCNDSLFMTLVTLERFFWLSPVSQKLSSLQETFSTG